MLIFIEKLLLRLKNRYEPAVTRILGFPIKIVDKSSFLYMYEEIFEMEIYKFPTVKAPRIIDGGANIGLASIYWKQQFPDARITAFEPDPEIFKVLKENLLSAGIDDIELINACLAEKEGVVSFFQEGSDGGRIALDNDRDKKAEIKAVTLSPYLQERVDFLKLDIEGAEDGVIQSIKSELKKVRRIFIEYHSAHDRPQTLDSILNVLSGAGFRYYIESVGVSSDHPYLSINTHMDWDLQLNIFGYRI